MEKENKRNDKTIRNQRVVIIILVVIILLLLSYMAYKLGNIGDIPTSTGSDTGDIFKIIIQDSEETGGIIISDDEQIFNNGTQINIFRHNSDKVKTDKIAPQSTGIYKFYLKNENAFPIYYNIKLTEENTYSINMKFRLKQGDKYLIGNENEWISISDLTTNDILLSSQTYDAFELEWCWFESSNDTYVGTQVESYYKLFMEVYARQYQEEI